MRAPWRRLGIEAGEERVFAWAAATLFLAGWAEVSVKNVAETLFLKRVGVEYLPLVFLANSALLVGTTYAVGRLAARRDRLRLLPRMLVGLSLGLLPLWLLVRLESSGAFALLVVASKQLQSIALLSFWVAVSDLVHARDAKRLYAPLTAGLTLGTMAGSFACEPLGRALGIDGLLPISAAVLALGAATALPLRAGARPRLAPGAAEPVETVPLPPPGDDRGALRALWRESWLFRLLAAGALLSGLLGPMLYFQFSYVADLATGGRGGEDRLLALYAQFRGWLNVGILAAQLAASAPLYRRIGVPLSAALAPLVYLLGFVGLSVRLSLPAGIGAMAATKLEDQAVYDPAMRILFNLFPERVRSRAMAFLEEPVKRAGGAFGNVLILAALALGSAPWVGYAGLPIAALWLVAALALWRAYPQLLLQACAGRSPLGRGVPMEQLLDRGTLRALARHLRGDDPERCRAALALIAEARRERAIATLAAAVRAAPEATRPLVIEALDRLLEEGVAAPLRAPRAARDLEALLAAPVRLAAIDRANALQAYGRLADASARADGPLRRALADPEPAVRLAARAALARRGEPGAADLPAALTRAAQSEDAAERVIAREEARALALQPEPGGDLERALAVLTRLLERSTDRAAAAEALADAAARHGPRVAAAGDALLARREDPDPRVRAAALRFAGHAGRGDEARGLVERLGSPDAGERRAAREGLIALGPAAAEALLGELAFGWRSRREALLEIARELRADAAALRELYAREVQGIEGLLLTLAALDAAQTPPLLRQRLGERVEESLHTVLLLLAAIGHDARLGELAALLRRAPAGRQRAVLLEVLDALLPAPERARLLPYLDGRPPRARARAAARSLGRAVPSAADARRALLEDPDDLTRALAAALLPEAGGPPVVAGAADLADDPGVRSIEIAMRLRGVPLFESLTTRQLVDLAKVVREERHSAGHVVVREGAYDDCLYLIAEGRVRISRGSAPLAELGPGDFFGEMAVFEGSTRSATAAAESAVRLLRLERVEFLRLLEELPAIAIGVCQTLSRRVRDMDERL